MRQAPEFERMLVRDGIILFKFWFSVSPQGADHPVHHPPDRPGAAVEAVARWTSPAWTGGRTTPTAKEAMFWYTDTEWAPWTVVRSNDKKRGRLEAMRWVLRQLDYPEQGHRHRRACPTR